ncbi:hypothetical protein MVEN_00681900 [Mycena venus]|uniref:MULE transposase domain-containing protein n=1 Tax=Mycena venus TaxID=2733690 RepID=A0A8H6YI81_9AGAR|nr:hypothetical protein MVEN_00681900 [Mycena venus]
MSIPLLSSSNLDTFLDLPICAPIFGFYVTEFPLWKLSCLLGEEWLHEDILNALTELLYFSLAANSPSGAPSTLILPTHCLHDAKYLFDQSPRSFSSNLAALRDRLRTTTVEKIFAFNCASNHYSLYSTTGTPELKHDDSLHLRPDSNVFSVKSSVVPRQAAGSGSCGIAALNFAESRLDTEVGPWETSTSPFFRNRALRDLILYHVTASTTRRGEETYENWVMPCLLNGDSAESPIDHGPVGYNDFNLDAPNTLHPIHRFLGLAEHPLNASPLQNVQEPEPVESMSLLSCAQTADQPQSNTAAFPELLQAPFEYLPTIHSSGIVLDLTGTPEPELGVSDSIIDLCTPSPAPKPMAGKHEAMDIDIIDLTCSPIQPNLARPLPCRALHFLDLKPDPSVSILDPVITLRPHSGSDKENVADQSASKSTALTGPLIPVETVRLGSFYSTFEQGLAAVNARENPRGYLYRIGQTKRGSDQSVRRITERCNHYGPPAATHRDEIDPSDHREGRTIRTNCSAHVNLACIPGGWHVTVIDWTHNHPPYLPVGGHIPRRPTQQQRDLVSQYASRGNFTRSHMSHILQARFPDHLLEPRQITNIINGARKMANEEILALGGDVPSVLSRLRELKEENPRWDWDVKLDGNQVVIALWWQSPEQVDLARRFSDVLINDNTYCRNQYGYPLNIGIIIDNFGKSRNCWYAVHRSEDTETHNWVFRNHLRGAGRPPEVLGSDRHGSLIASASDTLPLTFHLYCLHHLGGNVTTHLRPILGAAWDAFNRDFWVVYRALSPEEFDRKWNELITQYPAAAKYLDEELYSCRSHWAWAWVSNVFTAGVRTTGRAEGENRINKAIGGPKKTFLQLFEGLNKRTQDQTTQDLIQVRQSSRRRHDSNLESLFAGPLKMLRDHAGPLALQTCYKQMQLSLFYSTEVIQRPNEVESWTAYALSSSQEPAFDWMPGEQNGTHFNALGHFLDNEAWSYSAPSSHG